MSASREKRKRQELYEAGDLTRDERKPSGGLPKAVNWLIGIGAIVVAVAFVCLMVFNSNMFLNGITAVKVGGINISAGEAGYYYWDAASTVASYYGDYFQYFVDTSKSYKSQQYDENHTWADYFMSNAESSMQQLAILHDEAVANGFTLTEEQQQTIESNLTALKSTAAQYGYSDANSYLRALYGKAASVESFEQYLTRQALAQAYYTHLIESYSFTQEDLDNWYAAHTNDYDTVSYRVLSISSSDTLTPEAAKAEAERIAESSANHEATFLREAEERNKPADDTVEDQTYDADSATLCDEYRYSKVSSDYAEWLFDAARVEGETYVAENVNSSTGVSTYYVLYFLGRQTPDYQMVNVRHILIKVDDTSDTEAMAKAKAEAELILSDWESGDATEDSFAALAQENSDDSSASNGGLITDIYKGQMVEAFNDWCFDENRQVGDTGIVETQYGYHVMYFSGYSEDFDTYGDYMVDSTLRSNAYTEWYTGKQADYPITEKGFGMLFVHR